MLKEMQENDFIVSKTDKSGRITYVNQIFMDMSEYSEKELLGKPHSIIRHPDMPRAVFRHLWQTIENKEECFAFVINKTKNGNDYWVYANITADLDSNGNIIGYYSVRRRPNPKAIQAATQLYKKMIEAEKTGGMDASFQILVDTLEEKGKTYDEFVISLQDS